MRHGEAERFQARDSDRALTRTGRAAVASKQPYMPVIDLLWVSPYLRALQTADILVEQGLIVRRRQVEPRLLPDCPVEPLIDALQESTLDHQLIVGHNPLLSSLLSRLCGDAATRGPLATAELVCLQGDALIPGLTTLAWAR